GDAENGVDLVATIAAAEFHFVAANDPTERTGNVKRVLIGITRAGDGIPDGRVACYLDEWRPGRDRQRGIVLETKISGSLVVQVLVEQELIAEKGKPRDSNQTRRKGMRFLRDEVLGAVVRANRKARDIRTLGRERIGGRAAAVHITEAQR